VTLDSKPKLSGSTSAWAIPLYRSLSNDALRVLAGLPGNERAFTQVTIQPLDPKDPNNANRSGPDDLDSFKIGDPNNPLADASLCTYIATLDGRSTNCYFYRSAYVDDVHNRSEELSVSSPPVFLRNVIPPRAPVITKELGGDREITLKWASNREMDLKEYRIYRTQSKDSARDLRLMELVHTEMVSAGDPSMRPAELEWTDKPVHGLVNFYYRLVAEDEAGNVSDSSLVVSSRAYDLSPPPPPKPTGAVWVDVGGIAGIRIDWALVPDGTSVLVQRRQSATGTWVDASEWLESNVTSYVDVHVQTHLGYIYRLYAQSAAGNLNEPYLTIEVPSFF